MVTAGWVSLAFAFAAVWLYAFLREDLRHPEPVWMVLLAIAGGVGALVAADRIEAYLVPDLGILARSMADRAWVAFGVSGPVEEGLKFLAVLLLVWPRTHFDEPMDGIVYAAAAGVGFALAENLAFMVGQPEVIVVRGPAATAVHVLFAAFWGGALGHARHESSRAVGIGIVTTGLVLAALAHGAFNMVTFSVEHGLDANVGRALQLGLVLLCALFLRWRLRVAHRRRPFRYRGGSDATTKR